MIQRLFVDKELHSSEWEPIAEKLNLTPLPITKDELTNLTRTMPIEEKFLWGKSSLFLTRQKGKFLKKCPGSTGVLCCNYFTLNTTSGCPFDCSYCILQNYIENNPFITAFVNREDMVDEIDSYLRSHPKLRVGTGELADSLALDHILEESRFLLRTIHQHQWTNRITLELKTKSANITPLLAAHNDYPTVDVVVGFSVNIDSFTSSDEERTAPIEERIQAMQKLQSHGIDIALHFDPIVMLDELLPLYKRLAEKLMTSLDHTHIRWISLGGYRHTLTLSPTIEERFPHSLLLAGEMFPSESDHKYRYLHSIRRMFYTEIITTIRANFPQALLYLCMEKPFIWAEIGITPLSCQECFG